MSYNPQEETELIFGAIRKGLKEIIEAPPDDSSRMRKIAADLLSFIIQMEHRITSPNKH